MKFPRLKNRGAKESTIVVEEAVAFEDNDDICTFDLDADPSKKPCDDDDTVALMMGGTKNQTLQEDTAPPFLSLSWPAMLTGGDSHHEPLMLAGAGITVTAAVVAAMALLLRKPKARSNRQPSGGKVASSTQEVSTEATTTSTSAAGKSLVADPHVAQQLSEATVDARVRELKVCLERETKEKQGLSEQNNFLKSALEERKATVQMFTSELQSRDEQLANFEQEQIKVKNELYNQIEALKNELQTQEKMQQENLNNMDGQCADLAGKVEGLMKELANREEQWEKFEKDAKAKEIDSVAQIEAIKKEFAAKEQAQKESINAKSKQCTELNSKLETLSKEMKDRQEQLVVFQKQREKWTEASLEMKRLLKEKREEINGLTTRMELFMSELKSREERVKNLEQKLVDKKELTDSELDALRRSLKDQTADHEAWNAKTAEIQRLLTDKEQETKELTDKLESLTKDLRGTSEKVAALEASIQDKEYVISSNRESIEKKLGDEQKQRAKWGEQFFSMSRLLKARQEECASLTARVEIFAVELQSRETIVESLQGKVKEKESLVATQLESLEKELLDKQAFRDTWSQSTKEIHRLLEEKKEQCVGLSTRVDLFQMELRKREERVATLESVLKEREDASAATLEPYQTQLKAHQEDLKKWTGSTDEIKRLLQERKSECIGLTTRLSLFKQKLAEYEGQVDVIERKVNVKMGSHSQDIAPLRDELKKQQQERDSWNQKTTEIASLLEDRQNQCVGLTTRAALFERQTKFHEEQVQKLQVKAKDLQERFDYQIIPLKKELKVQREGLDSWRESTHNVEHLLKKAQQDCIDLTAELKLHIVKLQSCQKAVANLQTRVLAKEDLVATEKALYLAQRQKEEAELDKWSNSTKDLERLLGDKEGQIIGLTTRLSLFATELSTRQNTVTELETKVKERGHAFNSKIAGLENELRLQREQRDHCLDSTLHMNKSMKEVKEPCIGLTTRLSLFRKELDGREERVRLLEAQVREKSETAESELGPLRKEFEKHREERDKWNQSTLDIFWMLKERQDQIVGLTTRLELFMSELQKKEEAVDVADTKLKECLQGLSQMDNLKNEIKVQEDQRRKWNDSTNEVAALLRQKQEQRSRSSDKKLEQECISLSAKLELFRGELQRREEKVKNMKSTQEHRGELLLADKASLEKSVSALKEDRDSWMEKTLNINKTLKDTQAQCLGLSTRWDLFKNELKSRKEVVAALETKLKDREEHHSKMMEPYSRELKVQIDLRDKWLETIEKMERLLKKKESECITFTTQLETAIDDLASRKEQVASLEARLSEAGELSKLEMENLNKQLHSATESLTSWKASTQNVEKLLKEKRQECANLRVRLQVFNRQVENQDNRIATLENAFKAKQEDMQAQMDALQEQLREQQMTRDESVSNTLDMNRQIKAKESQCTSISVRLSLFKSELENREKCVATLEEKLNDVEGMSALHLDPVKAQLYAQKEELEKWSKNTKEIQQLLKQRDEERIGLSTRLKLFQLQLKTIEENVARLEQRVKEREEAASIEMAPFKNALDAQRAERDRWTESTMEIQRLLQDRKGQITGLTTRLALFRREVKHREQAVTTLESKLREKQEDLNAAKIEPIKKELETHLQQRDQWAETTAGIVNMLRTKRGECHGLTTRLACFKIELQKREEACNILMKKVNDKKEFCGSQVQVLQSELAMQMEQRDKWRETTAEMQKQLADRKVQCTGLSTRVELFQKEIQGHDDAIAGLKLKLQENDAAIAEVEELKKELRAQKEHRDALTKAMQETDELLKEKKEQCAGLATRLTVFRQQLKERMDRLASTETKIKEKEEMSTAQIESLKIDLQAQREQRDKWTETTEELKKLLEEKEHQCSTISAELELLASMQVGET